MKDIHLIMRGKVGARSVTFLDRKLGVWVASTPLNPRLDRAYAAHRALRKLRVEYPETAEDALMVAKAANPSPNTYTVELNPYAKD